MIHLSSRLAWHDTGWNGRICQYPYRNASCIVQQNIREERNDELEQAHAGVSLRDLEGWLPPCSRDTNAFSSLAYSITHADPLKRGYLKPIVETIDPYTCLPAPYRWLREENLRDISESEALSIRGPEYKQREVGWVYEPDRQRVLLDHFWGQLKVHEGQALVFFYVNQGNPVDENIIRLIVGVSRIKKIGPQLFFEGTDPEGKQYPIWTRSVTHDPSQALRLPYQEYLQAGYDPSPIVCPVPPEAMLAFSFIGEHVSDDLAVGILERLVQSVRAVKQDGKVEGPWQQKLNWLDDRLAEVWTNRGPYPGIGAVLRYLGFSHGTAFQRIALKDFARQNENPWAYVESLLEGRIEPAPEYRDGLRSAGLRWSAFSRKPVRQQLLKKLIHFELTTAQIERICDPDQRREAGILASEEELIGNPYLISELDLGTADSKPVSLDSIDRGMLPDGDAVLFVPAADIVTHDDTRRVRATAVDVLRNAAEQGDTVLTQTELFTRIRERFTERRACRPDRDVFAADADFHGRHLWLQLDKAPALVALHHLNDLEKLLATQIKQRVKRRNAPADPAIDWYGALVERFGNPQTDREAAALEEKTRALDTLFMQRISVLTGGAGTGKTSALRIFLQELERAEGKKQIYLLAPTGKARVRLSTETKRNAFTIHQFLFRFDWFLPEVFRLKEEGGAQTSAATIIIDECSMVPTDLFGTLFKAINMGLVTRLILVGDPNQLPPIGPGRPFVDIVNWLRTYHPQCLAELRTTMRTADDAESGSGQSIGLAFADGYRSNEVNPADDELLSRIARQSEIGDLEVHFWDNHEELNYILDQRLGTLLGVLEPGDYTSFNQSLGITARPDKQSHWRDVENWQILSPVRADAHGTEELNRAIQSSYRGGLIHQAQNSRKMPNPFGEHQIVSYDKVIQIVNRRHRAWPQDSQNLDYIANGEIGVVTTAWKNNYGSEYLQVGFSTQDGVTYRYYRGEVDENLELAYALTVHKSQGSDFEIVFLIIPQEAPTLSRELIYTGLTRFRKKLVLLVEKDTGTLEALRSPERSATYLRNTFMFDLSVRPDESTTAHYAEGLIHRAPDGTLMRSKSEVIVAQVLESLKRQHSGLSWVYEQRLTAPDDTRDFRLPDFTVGFAGDTYYWEHLGMLRVPGYREGWRRKRKWYEERLGYPVVGPGGQTDVNLADYYGPLVITSVDNDDGSIDVPAIEQLARKYILQEI